MAKAKPTAGDTNQGEGAKTHTGNMNTMGRLRVPEDLAQGTLSNTTQAQMNERATTAPSGKAPTTDPKHTKGAKTTERDTRDTNEYDSAAFDRLFKNHDPKLEVNTGSQQNAGDNEERSTPPATKDTSAENAGDVPSSVAEVGTLYGRAADENLPREESQADATRRWRRTGIAEQVAVYRDRKREEYSRANPKAKRRDAHEYAWECAMAEFPPAGVEPQIAEDLAEPEVIEEVLPIGNRLEPAEQPTIEAAPPAQPADNGVSGLGDLPESWGNLPANAQLPVEIAWVSANRLKVRSGNGVDLSRALSPAPSYSALSWLETSILFPSKFAEITVKASATQDDEREGIRREKLAIEEIRGLLAEMLE